MKLTRFSLAAMTLVVLGACTNGNTITAPVGDTLPKDERLEPVSPTTDLNQCDGKIIQVVLPNGELGFICESPHSGSGG